MPASWVPRSPTTWRSSWPTVSPGRPRRRPPPLHRRLIHPQIGRGLLVRPALRAAQHDLRPQCQELGGLRTPGPPDQLDPLRVGQDQVSFAPADRRSILQPGQPLHRELAPPLRHRLDRHPQRLCRPGIRHPLRTRQDDPRPVSPPAPRPLRPAHQLSPLILRQHDRHGRRTRTRHNRRLAASKHNPQDFRRGTLVVAPVNSSGVHAADSGCGACRSCCLMRARRRLRSVRVNFQSKGLAAVL